MSPGIEATARRSAAARQSATRHAATRHAAGDDAAGELLDRAQRLHEQYVSDPRGVLRVAGELLDAAGRRYPEVRVVTRHAAAYAHFELGDPAAARREATQALHLATRAGLTRRAAQVRLALAWLELDRGHAGQALAHLDAAQPVLRGRDAGRARCLRGLNKVASGDLTAGLAELTAALPLLRRHGDLHFTANALMGRGIAHTYTEDMRAADADFARAAELFEQLDMPERAATALNNRGFTAARSGDVPRALALFDAALAGGADSKLRPEMLIDRAEALLAGGLTDDARPVLDTAIAALAAAGRGTKQADAEVVAAYSAMRARDLPGAEQRAAHAAKLLRAQGRLWWIPLVEGIRLRSRWLAGDRSPALMRAAIRRARECDEHGWRVPATVLRITAARVALERGDVPKAAELLAPADRSGPVTTDVRAAAFFAQALLRRAAGDRRGALAACRAGLASVDAHAAGFGSPELRTHAMRLARDLAELAVGEALAGGSPFDVLRWTERYRAGALTRPPVLPPTDPQLADELTALRAATATAREAVAAGRPDPLLERRVARLELSVRRRSLLTGSDRSAPGARPATSPASRRERLDQASVRVALAERGDAALVSLVAHDGALAAVVLAGGRCTLHWLGEVAPIGDDLAALRFGLHRLARGASEATAKALRVAVEASARELDDALLRPLRDRVGDRPLVVVPTGPLHALPWAALPSCAGRPVTVAPSVLSWLRACRDAPVRPAGRTVRPALWAAGPGLRHAEAEARALRDAAGGGTLLTGAECTVDAVIAHLDGCPVAHIAAHGRFRSDQPLFSSLELTDGPLSMHDLDRLRRPPRLLVLSACESGLSSVRPGDELMGLAAALLARGTSTLIGTVVPIPDDRATPVVRALHEGLRAGVAPAAALAAAQAEHGQLGFVCFGAG